MFVYLCPSQRKYLSQIGSWRSTFIWCICMWLAFWYPTLQDNYWICQYYCCPIDISPALKYSSLVLSGNHRRELAGASFWSTCWLVVPQIGSANGNPHDKSLRTALLPPDISAIHSWWSGQSWQWYLLIAHRQWGHWWSVGRITWYSKGQSSKWLHHIV